MGDQAELVGWSLVSRSGHSVGGKEELSKVIATPQVALRQRHT